MTTSKTGPTQLWKKSRSSFRLVQSAGRFSTWKKKRRKKKGINLHAWTAANHKIRYLEAVVWRFTIIFINNTGCLLCQNQNNIIVKQTHCCDGYFVIPIVAISLLWWRWEKTNKSPHPIFHTSTQHILLYTRWIPLAEEEKRAHKTKGVVFENADTDKNCLGYYDTCDIVIPAAKASQHRVSQRHGARASGVV